MAEVAEVVEEPEAEEVAEEVAEVAEVVEEPEAEQVVESACGAEVAEELRPKRSSRKDLRQMPQRTKPKKRYNNREARVRVQSQTG